MHVSLTAACLAVIAVASLILAGYIPGWLRGRAVGRGEREMADMWAEGAGPEGIAWAEDTEWARNAPTVAMQVPNITEVPTPERRRADREWLAAQGDLGGLVNGTVVGGVPRDTIVSPVLVTSPQSAVSDEVQLFLAEMRQRTDAVIASLAAPLPPSSWGKVPTSAA